MRISFRAGKLNFNTIFPMNCKKCPVCQVLIEDENVIFHYGKPGTRSRLYARVCQYTQNELCINKINDYPDINPSKKDFYRDIPPIVL